MMVFARAYIDVLLYFVGTFSFNISSPNPTRHHKQAYVPSSLSFFGTMFV
jgi:hypothetical protein